MPKHHHGGFMGKTRMNELFIDIIAKSADPITFVISASLPR